MNKLDMMLLLPIGLGFTSGLFKGLIREITSLGAIVLGVFGAKWLAPFVSELLVEIFHLSPKMALPMAYLLLFIGIAIALLMVAKSLEKVFESMSLGGLNKLFGGIFGALKSALIVSVLLIFFNAIDSHFSILTTETKDNSISYKPLLKLAPTLWKEAKSKQILVDEKDEEHSN